MAYNTNTITLTNPTDHVEWTAEEWILAYTVNALTLCQAALGLRNFYLQQSGGYTKVPASTILQLLGHRLTWDEHTSIELGYEGSVDRWMADGHLPQGWYQLFEDNYYQYLDNETPDKINI